ncbi:hypothetical protein GCM10010411_62600 [Actinomadura fulvescens]|uniref:Uncharacterized protein n=1 Tax=Actinomadura fulvescens TaxID=46160 RepID=A0ABN3Q6I6_9ACTN
MLRWRRAGSANAPDVEDASTEQLQAAAMQVAFEVTAAAFEQVLRENGMLPNTINAIQEANE